MKKSVIIAIVSIVLALGVLAVGMVLLFGNKPAEPRESSIPTEESSVLPESSETDSSEEATESESETEPETEPGSESESESETESETETEPTTVEELVVDPWNETEQGYTLPGPEPASDDEPSAGSSLAPATDDTEVMWGPLF